MMPSKLKSLDSLKVSLRSQPSPLRAISGAPNFSRAHSMARSQSPMTMSPSSMMKGIKSSMMSTRFGGGGRALFSAARRAGSMASRGETGKNFNMLGEELAPNRELNSYLGIDRDSGPGTADEVLGIGPRAQQRYREAQEDVWERFRKLRGEGYANGGWAKPTRLDDATVGRQMALRDYGPMPLSPEEIRHGEMLGYITPEMREQLMRRHSAVHGETPQSFAQMSAFPDEEATDRFGNPKRVSAPAMNRSAMPSSVDPATVARFASSSPNISGGVQEWSRGEHFPYDIRGIGDLNPPRWQAGNHHSDMWGIPRENMRDAVKDRNLMKTLSPSMLMKLFSRGRRGFASGGFAQVPSPQTPSTMEQVTEMLQQSAMGKTMQRLAEEQRQRQLMSSIQQRNGAGVQAGGDQSGGAPGYRDGGSYSSEDGSGFNGGPDDARYLNELMRNSERTPVRGLREDHLRGMTKGVRDFARAMVSDPSGLAMTRLTILPSMLSMYSGDAGSADEMSDLSRSSGVDRLRNNPALLAELRAHLSQNRPRQYSPRDSMTHRNFADGGLNDMMDAYSRSSHFLTPEDKRQYSGAIYNPSGHGFGRGIVDAFVGDPYSAVSILGTSIALKLMRSMPSMLGMKKYLFPTDVTTGASGVSESGADDDFSKRRLMRNIMLRERVRKMNQGA